MPFSAEAITLTDDERGELESMNQSRTLERRVPRPVGTDVGRRAALPDHSREIAHHGADDSDTPRHACTSQIL